MTRNKRFVIFVSVFLICLGFFLFPGMVPAAPDVEGMTTNADNGWVGFAYIAAALSVGLACIASSFAVARIGSSGMGAMSEKPELTGRVLIFLGLAEGIAIYGLIIAIMILNKL